MVIPSHEADIHECVYETDIHRGGKQAHQTLSL
jgi:hypothetical protein